MLENYPIKVDSAGRVVIPNKIRSLYDIIYGMSFTIKEDNGYIKFIKCNDDEEIVLIKKIVEIEKLYFGIKFVLYKNREVLYKSKNINNKNKYYYCGFILKNNTCLNLKIMYENKSRKIALIVGNLLNKLK